MRLRYLGTAAAEGVPALFCTCPHCTYARKVGGKEIRGRSGSIVDGVLKLDYGPDSYAQMIQNHLDYTHIHSLLITHTHSDHLLAADLQFREPGYAQVSETEPPLVVYGNEAVKNCIRNYLNDDYLQFRQLHRFETTDIEGYAVTPLEAVHCRTMTAETFPVCFEGQTIYRSEEAFFYLIEKDGKKLLYAHDTDEFTPSDMAFLEGKSIDYISLDCTNAARHADYVGHMGTEDVLRMREKLLANGAADAHTTFAVNHFSHNGLVAYEKMQALLPNFIVSYDGLEVEI